MSEPQYLTNERFDSWAGRFEQKLDAVIQRNADDDKKVSERVTAIETKQANAGKIVMWLAGIIATVVTSLLLAATKALGVK